MLERYLLRRTKNKKGMEAEFLGWAMIALGVLVIMLIGYAILRAKGIDALEYLKNIIRFGG